MVLNEDVLTDESGTSATITSNDELPSGNGYTQDDMALGAATITEDDNYDCLNVSFPTVTWTASGGDIGATPGAIIYDDTTTDKIIIGYLDFGGAQTAVDGTTFNIASITIRIL